MKKRFKKVYIEITNVCNLSCSFCPKTKRLPCQMTVETFARVLEQVKEYTDYVYLHLMGEPLLHPALRQILELCRQAGIQVNLTTNGVEIGSAAEILRTAPALRKVGFSLHSYEANCAVGTLDTYLDEILSFVDQAEALICELRLWNGDSAARDGKNDLNGEILRQIERRLGITIGETLAQRGSVKLKERLFLGFGEIFDWPQISSETTGGVFCYGLRDQIGVLADGTVVPCCLDSEGALALGNLLIQPLGEILDSPRAREIYEGFSQRKAVEPLCRGCGYARRFTAV